ncbi:MAG: hypothetical protein ABIZ52_01410 [Candidatus Limnocylindrales bacterium]
MNGRDDLDLRITELLDELTPARMPEYLDELRGSVTRRRQRPAWSFLSRWLPIDPPPLQLAGVRRLALLGVALLLVAALVVGAIVGSQRRLPPPFGRAVNGLIAFDDGSRILVSDGRGGPPQAWVGAAHGFRPAFSPDGTQLAFLREHVGGTALEVADAGGAQSRTILEPDPAVRGRILPELPVWAPDSGYLAVSVLVGDAPSEHAEIWIVDTEAGRRSTLLPSGLFGAQYPAWSPDGSRIAFLGEPDGSGTGYLYVARIDGSGLVRISDRKSSATTGYFQQPRWAPDGRRIAVHYGEPRTIGRDILLLATDDLEETAIAGTPRDEAQPAWSPDGTRLAFWRSTDGRDFQIVVVDVTSRRETPLDLRSPLADILTWSPDGASIVAVRCATEASCDLLLVDSTNPARAPTVLATGLPPASLDLSGDRAYWSWQRLAP